LRSQGTAGTHPPGHKLRATGCVGGQRKKHATLNEIHDTTFMPGTEHEWLIDVFRAAPSLLSALLQSLGFQVPDEWEVTENNVGDLLPRERRVDLFLVAPNKTRLVVEVQTQPDNEKPVIWAARSKGARPFWR